MTRAAGGRLRNFGQRVLARLTPEKLVAPDPLTDRALVAVIVILTFIAALTAGVIIYGSAVTARWNMVISSEMTVQIKPQAHRSIDADLARATEILTATAGVSKVRPYSQEETSRLLEPWLGSLSSLGTLPIPRLIAVEINRETPPDIAMLTQALAKDVPTASLDDHKNWTRRLTRLGTGFVIAAVSGWVLVMIATALAIIFATRGAMVGNRAIIEVFYFMGADDRYIAHVFQNHFFRLGLKGAFAGSALALVTLALFKVVIAGSEGAKDLLGFGVIDSLSSSSLILMGAVTAIALFVSLLAAISSRLTVHATLGRLV